MKKIATLLLFALLEMQAYAVPKYGPDVTRLYSDRAHIIKQAAPDFWALLPYYVGQFNGSACSVASVTMVLNGMRAGVDLSATESLHSQEGLLKSLNDPVWNKGVLKGGGVTLDELGDILRKLLALNGASGATVEVVHVEDSGPETAARLHAALVANEKSDQDFLIFNFLERVFVGEPSGGGGHFAPVGAYDEARGRVLIFDPYRVDYEPYWLPESVALLGMATKDTSVNRSRGYLWVRR